MGGLEVRYSLTFCCVEASCVFLQSLLWLLLQHAEEFSTCTEFHHETETLGRLKGSIHSDDEGVVGCREDFTLGHHAFHLTIKWK